MRGLTSANMLAAVFLSGLWGCGPSELALTEADETFSEEQRAVARPYQRIAPKVAVVIYNPTNPADPTQRLHQFTGWYDPEVLKTQMDSALWNASAGALDYQLQATYTVNNFPVKTDGYRYTWETYAACLADNATCHSPDEARYAPVMNGTDFGVDLCAQIRAGTIDEVWIWGGPYFGFDEFAWKIPQDRVLYQPTPENPWIYDLRKKDLPDCGRTYFVMGFSAERPAGIHAYGHRMESALTASAPGSGRWERCSDREWTDFTCINRNEPAATAVGDVHNPPNATADYDYANRTAVGSSADDYFNYPALTGVRTNVSQSNWSGLQPTWTTHFTVQRSSGAAFTHGRWSTTEKGFAFSQKWMTGRFNSDTKTDFARYWNDNGTLSVDVYTSTGSTFTRARWATQQGGFWDAQRWFTGDFNGDGKTDLAKFWDDGGLWTVDVHLSTGSAFTMARWATRQGGYWSAQKWFTGDFNGDGRTDFAKLWDDGGYVTADVHLSTGSAFTMARWATQQGGYSSSQQWHTGDFNGDGRSDLAKFWDDGGLWTVDVHRSTGSAFTMARWATQQGGYWSGQQWHTGDFNGDGKTDFAKFWDDGGLWTVDVHRSTGSAFTMARWATGQGGYWAAQKWYVADFTGDGKADFAKYWIDSAQWTSDVHVSNGSAFTMSRWATRQGFSDSRLTRGWYAGDFDGDGKADLSRSWPYGNGYQEDGYLRWWGTRIPRYPGTHLAPWDGTTVIRNNWWHYVVCYDVACRVTEIPG